MPIRGPDPQLGQPGPLAHKIFVVLIKRHSGYGRPTQADVFFSKRELMRLILSSPSGPARHSPTTDFLGAGSGEASSSIFTPTASKSWSHSRSHKTELVALRFAFALRLWRFGLVSRGRPSRAVAVA